jgi:ADP-ribosylglycohydrolase
MLVGSTVSGFSEEILLGAIVGDVVGSVFENQNVKTTDFDLFSRFSRFTDDTVLTVAVADAILYRKTHPIPWLENRNNRTVYAHKLKAYGRRFPDAGYGEMFKQWLYRDSNCGYGSYGNGAAMRVSPVGFAFKNLEDVLREARLSALVTHNHPEAIKGAQAVACAVYLAHMGNSKADLKALIEQKFGYDLSQRLADIRPKYTFDSSSKGSVPQAIVAFLESSDFEDTIRKAISLGGDSDTIACMAGGIAQAYYKVIPSPIADRVMLLLDSGFRQVIRAFNEKYTGLSLRRFRTGQKFETRG